ncbi:hypothetical protein [Aquipuribacter nitratireducens]|uniref:Cell division protein FtsL n=1 Tax=Aquipuribacter nitratireducens TaxID=650104 RepID=A0ABW0GSJ8_9MICO
MSAQAAAARPVARPARPAARPGTRPAARPSGRAGAPERTPQQAPGLRVLVRPEVGPRRLGFALTCTGLLGLLMLALLLLNVAISANAFALADLQQQRTVLAEQRQSLEQQVLLAESPGALADRARALGMAPAPHPVVLAPDGTGAPPLTSDD